MVYVAKKIIFYLRRVLCVNKNNSPFLVFYFNYYYFDNTCTCNTTSTQLVRYYIPGIDRSSWRTGPSVNTVYSSCLVPEKICILLDTVLIIFYTVYSTVKNNKVKINKYTYY